MQVNLHIPLTIAFNDGQYTYTITDLKGSSAMAGQSSEQWPLENIANNFLGMKDLKGAQGIDRAIWQDIIERLKTAIAAN